MREAINIMSFLVGDVNTNRGLQGLVRRQRREIASSVAGGDDDVDQVDAVEMIREAEDTAIEDMKVEPDDRGELLVRLAVHRDVVQVLKQEE